VGRKRRKFGGESRKKTMKRRMGERRRREEWHYGRNDRRERERERGAFGGEYVN